MPAHWLAPMDFGWGIRLVRSQTAVEARTVLTDQLIGVVPLLQAEPGQSVEHAVALSTTGRVIATLTCVSPGSDTPEELRYRAVRLPEGAERAGALAVPCNGWPSPLQLRISPDDQLLVFTDAVGSAHSVSIDDGAMASADIAPPPDETSWYPYSAPIVDLAVTPSSDGVYLVTWDGTVQRRALPGLALEGTPHPAGLGTLDIDSYMPSVVSPLAVSADGTLLAYLLPEPPPGDGTGSPWSAVARRIAITDIATGALLSTLDAPELNPEQADFLGWSATTPAALAFTADGTGLVASLDQGVALWRCSDAAWPEPAAALTVTLAAPTTAHAGVGTALVATHVGDDNLHSHAFFANGEPIAPPSIERDVVWAPAAPGTVVVTVVVDDGMATGEASQTVTVLP